MIPRILVLTFLRRTPAWVGAASGLSIDYALDNVGNVVGLDERQVSGATAARTVDYDGLDRLMALKDGASPVQGFTYDATGNRLSRTTASTVNYTYPAGSHHLTKVGTQNRVYDTAGNSTSLLSKHFTYDDYGRMRQFVNGSTLRNQYRYNGRGERIAKINVTSPGSTLYYVYDEAGRLLGEYNSSGVAVKEYLWLDDTLVAILGSYQGHKLQYVLTDHLGTPRAVVLPATNTIIWRWDLTGSAFGDHAVQTNPDGDGANYTLHLRYPGQYFDGESGLHYNYFRDYDPSTGRYLQSDPIGLGGGLSTYGYAASATLKFTDPLGLAIYLQFHEVQPNTGYYHGKLVVIPENAARWKDHPLFKDRGFATFGGGPDGFPLDTMLHGDFNRISDVNDGFVECFEAVPMRGLSEDEIIFNLIYGTNRYNEMRLPYGFAPEYTPGFYNSNSFVRGLGASSGLLLPIPRKIGVPAPGYSKPVPMEYFK